MNLSKPLLGFAEGLTMDIDNKGVNQLLLSPLFLFDQILNTIVPGALFLLLLGLKGNATLRNVWLIAPFGYKTTIAGFLMLAYIVGNTVKLPLFFLVLLLSSSPSQKDSASRFARRRFQRSE
jgi:hypothetical protein